MSEQYQGLFIQHETQKKGILSMGTNEYGVLNIIVDKNTTRVHTDHLVLHVNHLRVPMWEHWSTVLLPTYLSVNELGYVEVGYSYTYVMIGGLWLISLLL